MPLISLEVPAGVVRHGVESFSRGRWRDANFVRWVNGSLRNIGGWRNREDRTDTNNTTNVTLGTGQTPRGMIAWKENSGTAHIAAGTYNKLWQISEAGTVLDITPAGFTTEGVVDAIDNIGYGGYLFGKGIYGAERPASGVMEEATQWSLGNWGEYLVGCANDDGKIYEWQLDTAATAGVADNPAAVIANAPINNKAIVVTEERFIFALAAQGNKRKIMWCDRENNTLWAPSATNQAGDIELSTGGEIMLGVSVRGKTLILTTDDAHTATYTAPPAVYGFEKVGNNCGAVSRQCAVSIDEGAFWMGLKSFFVFNGGAVQEVPCDVHDYVFDDINISQRTKVFAVHNGQNNELWWFYPSKGSIENDRYVIFDYQERYWNTGNLDRTAGVDAGVFSHPIYAASTGLVYDHEIGSTYADTNELPYAETGTIQLGNGDRLMDITEILPDHESLGAFQIKLKTKNYPNTAETTHGAYTLSSPTSVRVQGREVKVRLEVPTTNPYGFRLGAVRVDAKAGSKR